MHDLAHFEVALRNACDRALSVRFDARWMFNGRTVLPPVVEDGRDINQLTREILARAVTAAGNDARRKRMSVTPGRVVAKLTFGFWPHLFSDHNARHLWDAGLNRAFVSGTDRRELLPNLTRLTGLRNRIAHHEPVWSGSLPDPGEQYRLLVRTARRIDGDLYDYIVASSRVPVVLETRP